MIQFFIDKSILHCWTFDFCKVIYSNANMCINDNKDIQCKLMLKTSKKDNQKDNLHNVTGTQLNDATLNLINSWVFRIRYYYILQSAHALLMNVMSKYILEGKNGL